MSKLRVDKLRARMDEMGTPYSITIDFDSLPNDPRQINALR